jgi:hypothetical protein
VFPHFSEENLEREIEVLKNESNCASALLSEDVNDDSVILDLKAEKYEYFLS